MFLHIITYMMFRFIEDVIKTIILSYNLTKKDKKYSFFIIIQVKTFYFFEI